MVNKHAPGALVVKGPVVITDLIAHSRNDATGQLERVDLDDPEQRAKFVADFEMYSQGQIDRSRVSVSDICDGNTDEDR